MDIGTAKPSKEELSLAPHRLIDILGPIRKSAVGLESVFCVILQIS